MKRKKFIFNNIAVSGVVEALLIVALVAIILATIQLVYIPDIMEDKETDHMNEVEKQFSYLKSVIDIQSMTKEKILISSPVTLGSKELPYFVTMGATGQINVNDQSDVGNCRVKILPVPTLPDFPDGFITDNDGIPLTSIEYEASNSYIDDREYIFEGGGIIVQESIAEMMVKPSIIVENTSPTKITIYYNLPFFTSFPGRKSDASSYDEPDKTVFIHTNYSMDDSDSISVNSLQIHTNYSDAWYQTLIKTSTGLLWEYNETGDVIVSRDDSQSPPVIEITPNNKDIDLELTVVKIGVQTGPGII
jgi:hypothetical protein